MASIERDGHIFAQGQLVRVKSGKVYEIAGYRSADWSWKLKGERGYSVIQVIEGGRRYGPYRLIRESNLRAD